MSDEIVVVIEEVPQPVVVLDHQGPPGPAGPPGADGVDGTDGLDGAPGDSHVPTAVGVPDGKMLAAASDAWTIVDAPSGGGGVSSWNDLTGKPTEFPPEAHTHAQSEVTGLVDALAGKATTAQGALADTAVQPDALTSGLATKADVTHTHTIPDVEGLGEALTDLDVADGALDTRISAALAGPLGRWFTQLINDPATAKVVFLGDSTFYAGGGAGSTGSFYDTLRDWHTLPGMGLADVDPANLIAGGSSGGTLAQWLADEGSYTPADLIADDPHLIVEMYDLNAVRLGLATLEDLNADKEAFVAWRDANLPGADILFVTPPTMTTTVVGTDYVDGITHQAASDLMYQSAMAQVGRFDHAGVADTVSAMWGRKAQPSSPYKYDELHPSTGGYQMLAHVLADAMSPTGGYAHGPVGRKPFRYYGWVVAAGNGYFDLAAPDSDGRVPLTRLVPITTSDTVYFSGTTGIDLASATILDSGNNHRILLSGDHTALNGMTWMVETDQPASPVQSVNGQTGAVSLDKDDVGLGNVDNTADSAKSFTASQVSDFAETARDTIGTALVAGTNVTITVDDAGNTITIAASGSSTDPTPDLFMMMGA